MKIEILVQSNKNIENLERAIQTAAKGVGIEVQITRTSDFSAFSKFSINPAQTPIIFIDGSLEWAGRVPEAEALKRRLAEIRAQGTKF